MPWVLPVVKQAEAELAAQVADTTLNHEYLGIGGIADFTDAAAVVALGRESRAIAEGRVGAVYSALRFTVAASPDITTVEAQL